MSNKNRVFSRRDLFVQNLQKHTSRIMRKPALGICENKGADQLRSNCKADQHLCFRYTDSIISLLSNSEICSLQPSPVLVQLGLCRTGTETTSMFFCFFFISSWLIFHKFAERSRRSSCHCLQKQRSLEFQLSVIMSV